MFSLDSPASMSILEEATRAAEQPMMGVFNNLVMYDQHVAQNSLDSIVPDLATSWSWSEDGTELTFPLRQGVKWHDGKPFTAADVKCTWDLLTGKASDKLRINPRKSWYDNLEAGDDQRRLRGHLSSEAAAAGSIVALLASGWSPIYPCHVPPRDMRSIRSAPARSNSSSSSPTNTSRWRETRITGNRAGPISTASNTRSCANLSTRDLAFFAGKFDMTITVRRHHPDPEGLKTQAPQAICEMTPPTSTATLIDQPEKAALRQSRICGGRWR